MLRGPLSSRVAELPPGEAGFLENPGGSDPERDGGEAPSRRHAVGSESEVTTRTDAALPQNLGLRPGSLVLPHLKLHVRFFFIHEMEN